MPATGPDPAERLHPEEPREDARNDFERDRDRILYSSAFRRLAGITQVAAVREHHLLHNRLTHSLKVAQMGRRIAQRLVASDEAFHAGLDEDRDCFPDIVEAAGLAHDIGHPPFGHVAEGVLDKRMAGTYGGFEGNAQSFRVATKMAVNVNAAEYGGLNLTRATLNAILKYPRFDAVPDWQLYPWLDRAHGNKWGAYRSEQRDFTHARSGMTGDERSAAAMLMDWADDVSYVTHDVQDYFRAGLMPLHALHLDKDEFFTFACSKRRGYGPFDTGKFIDAFCEIKTLMPEREWRDTRLDRVRLDQLMHELIRKFFKAVSTDTSSSIKIDEAPEYWVEVLKQLTFYYVINQPALALAQEGQKAVIGRLFDELMDMLTRHLEGGKNPNVPVPRLLDDIYERMEEHEKFSGFPRSDEQRRARAVCDYICTLTEDQTLNLHERITGLSVSQASIFGVWFS
ncbi:dGTP triphosphohydrolase [Streptomyces sp. NPDC050315]|uniref:deoxyguanosinetriphosphate triphosphohydrolase family protein n=1 Tax=Streptomyces sp. NPDC050315 TaxID=3155039 RepID=UPI003422C208